MLGKKSKLVFVKNAYDNLTLKIATGGPLDNIITNKIRIMTLSITTLSITNSIECRYAECRLV
jgi:hypothetical protein